LFQAGEVIYKEKSGGLDGTGFNMLWVERNFEQEQIQSDLVDKRHLWHVTTPAFASVLSYSSQVKLIQVSVILILV